MPIGYDVAVRNLRLGVTRDYFAGGSLEVLTEADDLVATFALTSGGGTVAGGIWTLAFDAATVAPVFEGTIAKAQIKTSGGLAHGTGLTVGESGSGADIILDSLEAAIGVDLTVADAQIVGA